MVAMVWMRERRENDRSGPSPIFACVLFSNMSGCVLHAAWGMAIVGIFAPEA